jgi:hypothetical protein
MSKYAAKVTKLTGREILVSSDDIARTIWLVKRFTSLTYIQRMASLYFNFVAGYEEFAGRDPNSDEVPAFRTFLAKFYTQQSLLTDGIDLIRRRSSLGYAKTLWACALEDLLVGRPAEFGQAFDDVGWQYHPHPPEGLFAWAVVAAKMAANVDKTLRGLWAFPDAARPNDDRARASDILFPPMASIAPAPKPKGPPIKTGERVPVSGIWMPALPSGAPNHLWEGNNAWEGRRVFKQVDWPEVVDEGMPQAARTQYDYDTEPTTWTLLWEDDRYKDGKIPDGEAAYLDATTDAPPWPPVVPPGGAKLRPPILRGK